MLDWRFLPVDNNLRQAAGKMRRNSRKRRKTALLVPVHKNKKMMCFALDGN